MLLSHLLVEFDASLAGRICESESIVFKRVSSFSKYNYSGCGLTIAYVNYVVTRQ